MTHPPSSIAKAITGMQQNWPQSVNHGLAVTMAIHRASRLLDERTAAVLAAFDLSNTEFELLAVLRSQAEPHRMRPTQFYEAILISSGGLTKVLKGLETRALIIRRDSTTDGRSRPIELTLEGKMLAENAMLALKEANADTFSRFEEREDMKELGKLLLSLLTEIENGRQPSRDRQPE